MNSFVIYIEVREAKGKAETLLHGECRTDEGKISKVFINRRQSTKSLTNTFFHEIAHAFMAWVDHKGDDKEQERIARLVGDIVEPCFRVEKK